MSLTILSILAIILSTVTYCQFPNPPICQSCSSDDNCLDSDTPFYNITCQNFTGNNICYWDPQDIVFLGDDNRDHRICTHDGDAECIQLDATRTEVQPDGLFIFAPVEDSSSRHQTHSFVTSCLRCCPNYGPNNNAAFDLCTATIGNGEPCGTVESSIYWSTGMLTDIQDVPPDTDEVNYFVNVAPCCPNDICLDNIAGVCGFPADTCDPCTIWRFIIGDTSTYHSGDNCGEGLKCLVNNNPTITDYRPLIIRDAEITELNRRVRRMYELNQQLSPELTSGFNKVIYQSGICIPENGPDPSDNGLCHSDKACPNCMRCCHGICKRIRITSFNEECGWDERGPCCKGDECCDNECVTPTKDSGSA